MEKDDFISLEEYLPIHVRAYVHLAMKNKRRAFFHHHLFMTKQLELSIFWNKKPNTIDKISIDEEVDRLLKDEKLKPILKTNNKISMNKEGEIEDNYLILHIDLEQETECIEYILEYGTIEQIIYCFSNVLMVDSNGNLLNLYEINDFSFMIKGLSKNKNEEAKEILYNYLKRCNIGTKHPLIQEQAKECIKNYCSKIAHQFNDLFYDMFTQGTKEEIIQFLNKEYDEETSYPLKKIQYWLPYLMKRKDYSEILIEHMKGIDINHQEEWIQMKMRDIIQHNFPQELAQYQYLNLLNQEKKGKVFSDENIMVIPIDYGQLQKQIPINKVMISSYKDAMVVLKSVFSEGKIEGILGIDMAKSYIEEKETMIVYLTKESMLKKEVMKNLIIDYFSIFLSYFNDSDFDEDLYFILGVEDKIDKEKLKSWIKAYFFSNKINNELVKKEHKLSKKI